MVASTLAALLLGSGLATAASVPLTSTPGLKVPIPSWDLASSSAVSKDLGSLSKPGVSTSSWHHADLSRCTIMACLVDAGVYNDTWLFFSENLNSVDETQFAVPWVYRNEFGLSPATGQHFFLQTNGITSRADLFFNGQQIANSSFQVGSYGGHTYDITGLVTEDNALVVQAYPSDPNYDLVIGFNDWNPLPPDGGSGIWRDITVKQTGAVAMGPVSVLVNIETPVEHNPAEVIVRATAQNLENSAVEVTAVATITDGTGSGQQLPPIQQTVTLQPLETKLIEFTQTLSNPNIWWPAQWGGQPLYTTNVTFSVDSAVSDAAGTNFGIRNVTRTVTTSGEYTDATFFVNGYPFQVIGSGYTSDIFLRWDGDHFEKIAQYILDLNQNTVRTEGKMEHEEFYDITDRLGLMVMPGWECCDKWESFSFNDELSISPVPIWNASDYQTAGFSMIHEANLIQPHPSLLGFLVGSDYAPDDEAAQIYLDALNDAGWQNPIISSAAHINTPAAIGPSGLKMNGPYDWVPPNYWYDQTLFWLGSAWGFGSEIGSGVGTPELGSLKKFLSESDMDDLWKNPNAGLFHMSTNGSSFYNREIYNNALWSRYGAPTSLDDYLIKAQMMDYEATRSEFEAYASLWTAEIPATGVIYWMLNNAWPSLHWNQFDYYLHASGSYFGSKVGARPEHVSYNYLTKTVWGINRSLDQNGARTVSIDLVDASGKQLASQTTSFNTTANTGFQIANITSLIDKIETVGFLRLSLSDSSATVVSRNVYWLTNSIDTLNLCCSTWFYTPVAQFVDYTPLNSLATATLDVTASGTPQPAVPGLQARSIVLENKSTVPAVFIRLNLVDKDGNDVNPAIWSDNYVTLLPSETLTLEVSQWGSDGVSVQVSGKNIDATTIAL